MRRSIEDENTVDSLGIEMHHNNNSNGGNRSSGGGYGDHHHHHHHRSPGSGGSGNGNNGLGGGGGGGNGNGNGDHHGGGGGGGDRMATLGTNSSGYRSSNATITVVPHSFRRNPMYLPSPANSNCNTATLTNAIGTSGPSTTGSNNTSVLTSNMIKSGLYPVSDSRSKSSTRMSTIGIIGRVVFAFTLVAIPICVLFYFIYYEPLNNLLIASPSHSSEARSPTSHSSISDAMYKLESLSSVFVKTKYGTVQGERIEILSKDIDVFLGIPYAEPPIGDLRFRKPKTVKPWSGIYRAIRHSRPCLQYHLDHRVERTPWVSPITSSEDCLYLNIWASVGPSSNDRRSSSSHINSNANLPLKPVLVWIYGGAFISGSADVDSYDGGVLAAYGDIIVVTFNYRLGILGFLNTNHESSPGNQGLHDQVAALKWVKSNIEYFGGDPDKITLAGESAGAISVGFHLLSPLSRDLFNRAILQSGSPLYPQVLEDQSLAIDRAQQLAAKVSCANDRINIYKNPEDVSNCLRKLEANFLAKAADDMMFGFHPPFGATIGNEFLPINPYSAIKLPSELAYKKDILIGSVKDEGSFFLHWTFPSIFSVHNPKKVNSYQVIPLLEEAFKFVPQPGPKMISHFFMSELVNGSTGGSVTGSSNTNSLDVNLIREKFYETIGDFIITCPSVFFAESMASANYSVYHYLFTHRPSNSKWGKWMGVVHFDEVPFVFGVPFTKHTEYSEDERDFSARIMETWIHFIRHGKPSNQLGRSWPKYVPEERRYMRLDPYSSDIAVGPHENQCNLWRFMFQTASPAVVRNTRS